MAEVNEESLYFVLPGLALDCEPRNQAIEADSFVAEGEGAESVDDALFTEFASTPVAERISDLSDVGHLRSEVEEGADEDGVLVFAANPTPAVIAESGLEALTTDLFVTVMEFDDGTYAVTSFEACADSMEPVG